MPFGLSFAPTDQNQQEQNRPAGTPIQDAIKILSLRIPSFTGAQGIAPDPLLQSPGSGGFPFGGQTPGGLDEFLRRLFAGGMPGMPGQMPGGMPGAGSLPPPQIRPGTPPGAQFPIPSPEPAPIRDQMPQPVADGAGQAPQSGLGRIPAKVQRGIF